MDREGMDWAGTTANVDQTLAALRDMEYELLRFNDATKQMCEALMETGSVSRVQAVNIIHGIALSAIFPDEV